ncbi:class I adenylate-forming enzyme family protein [Halobacterium sp. R2-5]|uniref:class I adenylate-forming enzyme family protein n=1 Tax=Halobacterium sp. R2-5 TaxID=2715751 RepID=UPI001420F404|nr:class I adenylate-forming enzyme family protein [Halobacterium sp. R2-5]NIC00830.1 acyl--CoA ligase [Halobacterium sp. R2-5]
MHYLEAFERSVRVHGDETAIVTDDGRSFTYEEFDRRSTELANAVVDAVGDSPVAVLALNSPAAAEAMIAGHKRGTPTVQLSFRGSAGELVDMVETGGAEALVFDDANAERAVEVIDGADLSVGFHAGSADVDHPDVVEYEDALGDASSTLPDHLPADGKTNVFYTSGTTSTPKAVAFDGEQMWTGAYQGIMEHGIDQTDLAIVTTPWYHMVTSDAWLYPHWMAGATTCLQSDFDPSEVLELVEDHDATGLLAVPTQLSLLNDVQENESDPYDTSSLSYIRTGGSVVTEELVERTSELLSENLYNTYGMTEGGPNFTFAHPSVQDEHPGTIGKESFSWELRVVETAPITEHPDPEAEVGPGEQGEIIARGPGVPDGYIDNPEAEEKTFFGEWLRTRDVAEVDEDGFLYITDRVDNMFISGGENIYPAEVERAIDGHPAVAETLVFGQDDEEWGQKVTAIVVAEMDVDADEIDTFCRKHDSLANYKRPREYVVREEPLPRTDTGTVQRQEAIDQHFD